MTLSTKKKDNSTDKDFIGINTLDRKMMSFCQSENVIVL